MSEDRLKILNMLATGKITADEAERLLDALGRPEPAQAAAAAPGPDGPKYLRVLVEKSSRHEDRDPKQVNIRVPLQLLRSGVRLQGFMPAKARHALGAAFAEKGVDIDVDKLKSGDVDAFIDLLSQTSIDVDADDGRSRVKISCE